MAETTTVRNRRWAVVPEPALARGKVDLLQVLLREGEEAYRRAKEELESGVERVIVSQSLRAAGELLIEAAEEMGRQARQLQVEVTRLAGRRSR